MHQIINHINNDPKKKKKQQQQQNKRRDQIINERKEWLGKVNKNKKRWYQIISQKYISRRKNNNIIRKD